MPHQTAADYERRCEAFLQAVNYEKKEYFTWFEALLVWAEEQARAVGGAAKLKRKVEELDKELAAARGRIELKDTELNDANRGRDALGRQVAEQSGRLKQAHNDIRDAEERARRQEAQYTTECSRLTGLIQQWEDHARTMERKAENLQAKIEQMDREKEKAIAIETKKLKRQIGDLQAHIATYKPKGEYREISDEVFTSELDRLTQIVIDVPTWCKDPGPGRYGPVRDVDPTDVLGRAGWGQFIKSTCWQVFRTGFFALSLGFGSFGGPRPDGDFSDGYEEILQIRRLLVPATDTRVPRKDAYPVGSVEC
jgi:hypothetical protein